MHRIKLSNPSWDSSTHRREILTIFKKPPPETTPLSSKAKFHVLAHLHGVALSRINVHTGFLESKSSGDRSMHAARTYSGGGRLEPVK